MNMQRQLQRPLAACDPGPVPIQRCTSAPPVAEHVSSSVLYGGGAPANADIYGYAGPSEHVATTSAAGAAALDLKTKTVMDLIQEDFPRTPSPVFPLNIAGLAPDVGAHPDVAERHAADGLLPSEETARRPIPQQVNSNLETLSASIQALSVQPDTLPESATSSAHHGHQPDKPQMFAAPPLPPHGREYDQPGSGMMYPMEHPGGAPPPPLRAQHPYYPAGVPPGGPMYPMDPRVDPRFYRMGGGGYPYGGSGPNSHYAAGDPRLQSDFIPVMPMAGQPNMYWHDPRLPMAMPRDVTPGREVFMYYSYSNAPNDVHYSSGPGVGSARDTVEPKGKHGRERRGEERGQQKASGRERRGGSGRDGGNTSSRESAGAGGASRSVSLLEDFRTTHGKNRNWEMHELSGHIVQFCQDQHGSRFIQQRLEIAEDEEKDLIFSEVSPQATELMTDVFGNYVIQKMIEHGTLEHREALASLLTSNSLELALQMYGCRVIQKALEVLDIPRLIPLVHQFDGQVMKCVHDQNGNHVIQKCIEVINKCAAKHQDVTEQANMRSHIQFVIEAFSGQVYKLSTHPYGCRVIQRILEHCTDEQKGVVLAEINNDFGRLIQDQYGNYVIQHVMEHGRGEDREILMTEVRSRLLPYSQHKFASNVVEKCLQHGSTEQKQQIVKDILLGNNAENSGSKITTLQSMVRDQFANYVVQKVIDLATEKQLEVIIRDLKTNLAQIKHFSYGKHILARIEKRTGLKL